MGWSGVAWATKDVFAQLFSGRMRSAILAESCLAKDVFNLCHINHGRRALFFSEHEWHDIRAARRAMHLVELVISVRLREKRVLQLQDLHNGFYVFKENGLCLPGNSPELPFGRRNECQTH